MGYHKRKISPQGKWGEFSKIEEEIDEIRESREQNNKILELCEWADLIGAIEGYFHKYHPGITFQDLKDMSDATQRAFKDGSRKAKIVESSPGEGIPAKEYFLNKTKHDLISKNVNDFWFEKHSVENKNEGKLPTLEYLKAAHEKIHFFGLGFIQIKINEVERYHFYSDKLPAFVDSPHDHRYDFISNCLKGSLKHTFYDIEPMTPNKLWDHVVRYDSCTGYNKKVPESFRCSIKSLGSITQKSSVIKTIEHESDQFHTVEPLQFPTITHIKRGPKLKEHARIIEPEGVETDCPFSKKIDEEELWEIVKECLEA